MSSIDIPTQGLPPDLRKWEGKRQGGMPRFILFTGVLGWGVPMFLLMTFVVEHWWQGHPLSSGRIAVNALIWLLAGIFFGLTIWRLNEHRYQSHLKRAGK